MTPVIQTKTAGVVPFGKRSQLVSSLSFRRAIWFFPIAFTLHVLDEYPQFIAWAQHYASPQFTRSDYLRIHIAGIVGAFIASAVIAYFPNRPVVFLFLTFIFTPAVFYNTLFHSGSTIYFGVYCPGMISALLLYPPLFWFVSWCAHREGLISPRVGSFSLVISGVFHLIEVGHNVFKAW